MRCRISLAALAFASLAAALLAQPFSALAEERAVAGAATCPESLDIAILASPVSPHKGAPLRVVAAAEKATEGELSLIAPDGSVAAKTRERRGGPPYSWILEIDAPAVGKWRAKLALDGSSAECSKEIVVKTSGSAMSAGGKSVWPVRDSWNRGTENLYSAWIEKLFDAPVSEQPSWPALHEVLRDKSRNFLHNHLGSREDEKGMTIKPDCADLPYFLRGYFAFKMGLPFGYAKCSRGGGGRPPKCVAWWNIQNEEPDPFAKEDEDEGLFGVLNQTPKRPVIKTAVRPPGLVPSFGFYMSRTVANAVHSGGGRVLATDNDTDYYMVPLSEETLRPGTIFADPYGHFLVIARRVAQTKDAAGVILAVDGQPDGTVTRKRFWRGNFLFAQDAALGHPGFKRFRPIVREKGGLRRLTNSEIEKNASYADFSLDQTKLDVEAFYDRMDDVMSPAPLDPMSAMKETITSLEEQMKARVTSVENGRKYLSGGSAVADMPDGAKIFETTGAWEDFATPSRDLRLLIAIDVVKGFPERVSRRPERYAMPKDKSAADVKAELEKVLSDELASRKVSYTRTDGSEWPLALKDVVARAGQLEMAYNVNDCAELRWGASEGSDEAATCKRRAPEAQRAKMSQYREWFRERRRPPR